MWKYKVQLSPGESLRFEGRAPLEAGGKVECYSIVDARGDVSGTVQLTVSGTGPTRAPCQLRLVQRDAWDHSVVDVRWTG